MYRFGDGTPFPIQENFIDTLLAAVDACVGTFSAAAEIDDRRDKAKAAKKEADDELRRFGMMEKAVEAALGPMKPSTDRTATPSQQAAARALAAARHAIVQSRATIDQRLQLLAGEPRMERALERTRTAVAMFFERHQLPETAWRWTWTASGARVHGDAMAVAGRFRATFDLDLQGPWTQVVRVGALVPGIEAVVPRKKLLGGTRRVRTSLDRCGVIGVERSPERWVMVLREHAGKPSAGWRVVLRDPERAGVTLVPVDLSLRAAGNELALDADEARPFLALWEAIDDALAVTLDRHRRLRDLRIGDASLDSLTDPAMIGRSILGVLGPLVRQIRTRSRVPGELAIKRDVGDGVREELFVPREQIARKFEVLPTLYRRPFEEIGLGRAATAEIISSDDVQTMPEVPPAPASPSSSPPPPPRGKSDALAKLPPVPPTLPRVPLPPAADAA